MLTKLLLIGLGGGVGSVLRYLVSGWAHLLTTSTFPIGILVVNTSGCLLVGFLGTALTEYWSVREEYRFAILLGLLGGYTTFSTFSRETLMLVNDNQWLYALANVVLTNVCCLAAVWAGHRLAQRWFGL